MQKKCLPAGNLRKSRNFEIFKENAFFEHFWSNFFSIFLAFSEEIVQKMFEKCKRNASQLEISENQGISRFSRKNAFFERCWSIFLAFSEEIVQKMLEKCKRNASQLEISENQGISRFSRKNAFFEHFGSICLAFS